MIDDEYVNKRFYEIVDQQYIDESRFPKLTKIFAKIGGAVITSINAKNLYTGRDFAAHIDEEKVGLRTKSKIGQGIMATAGLVAISPIIVNNFSTVYGQITDGFRSI